MLFSYPSRLLPFASGVLAVPALLLPALASAETSFTQVIGLFNIFVGLMLTVALLTYFLGFFLWLCRLGTWPTYRTEAIKIMEWSVVILFVLVVLLAIVQFFQYHPKEASSLFGLSCTSRLTREEGRRRGLRSISLIHTRRLCG